MTRIIREMQATLVAARGGAQAVICLFCGEAVNDVHDTVPCLNAEPCRKCVIEILID